MRFLSFFYIYLCMANYWTIIVAGGAGLRMGLNTPKQFLDLCDIPILVRTFDKFRKAFPDMGIVVVLPKEHIDTWRKICDDYRIGLHTAVAGGASRLESVKAGLAAVPADAEYIAVHDGVRPFVSEALIRKCFAEAETYGSAIPVIIPSDSFRLVDGEASDVIDRTILRAVQTPQVFDAALLKHAYAKCRKSATFTDDAAVVAGIGVEVHLVEGERLNIKITTSADLLVGKGIIGQ